MTDLEAKKFYDELVDYYGKDLVDFEVYPRIFAFQVKAYKYYQSKKDARRA